MVVEVQDFRSTEPENDAQSRGRFWLMPTIFWPLDVKDSGFCYGWLSPAVCVAGVIQKDTVSLQFFSYEEGPVTDSIQEEAAETSLRAFCTSPQWRHSVQACGNDPTILGKCTFERTRGLRQVPVPSLAFEGIKSYSLIYYSRHATNSLRFYSLNVLKLDPTERSDKPRQSQHSASSEFDFTRPRRPGVSGGIDDTVVNQVRAHLFVDVDALTRHSVQHGESYRRQAFSSCANTR